VVLVAGVGLLCVRAGLLLDPARDEDPQQHHHEADHEDAADVLGERGTASR